VERLVLQVVGRPLPADPTRRADGHAVTTRAGLAAMLIPGYDISAVLLFVAE